MEIYKTKPFHRWARRNEVSDEALCRAVQEVQQGLHDGNLGGPLIKKRVAKNEQGKSSGFRTVIGYRTNKMAVFIYGFDKSDKSNIDKSEEAALKKLAKQMLATTQAGLRQMQHNGTLLMVEDDDEGKDKHSGGGT